MRLHPLLVPDIARHVLCMLDAKDVARCSLLCRVWASLWRDNAVWQLLYAARGWSWYTGMGAVPPTAPCAWFSYYLERQAVDRVISQPLLRVVSSLASVPRVAAAAAGTTPDAALSSAAGTTLNTSGTFNYSCRSVTVERRGDAVHARAFYGVAARSWSPQERRFLSGAGWQPHRVWIVPSSAFAGGFQSVQSTRGFIKVLRRRGNRGWPAGTAAGRRGVDPRSAPLPLSADQGDERKADPAAGAGGGGGGGGARHAATSDLLSRRRAAQLRAMLGRDPIVLRDDGDVAVALGAHAPVSMDFEWRKSWPLSTPSASHPRGGRAPAVDGSPGPSASDDVKVVVRDVLCLFVEGFGMTLDRLDEFRVILGS